MDKNTFPAYEFLPTNNNPEAQSDQFFVIQDDGTLMLNRQVQYVTEVQDVNEGMVEAQACAVYDVNPQEFFVDVANNPGELISVSDNFILPASEVSEEVNNLYGNSYLLQTLESDATAQGEAQKDMTITVQVKETEEQEEVDVVNIMNKQDNTCTEITLSDEQYSILEEKGWVLLESNGKIFILDAYGLHEVTTNEGLVQNQKDATKIDLPTEIDTSSLVKDIPTYPFNIVENIVCIPNTPLEQETVDTLKHEKIESEKEDVHENKLELNKSEEPKEKQTVKQTPKKSTEKLKESRLQSEMQKYQSSKIKILTKYSFKDIPDKIVLGRTRNGKKLVAKVVKRSVSERKLENSDEVKPEGSSVEPAHTEEAFVQEDSSTKATDIGDAEFESLVESALRGDIESGSFEVLDASDVITQLFHVPEFSSSVAGRNIVITRVSEKTSLGKTQCSISFVTGFVKSNENSGGGLIFIHVPHLLNKLTNEYDEYLFKLSSRSVQKPIAEKVPDCKILQVHIAETKHDGVQAISFILNERLLPCMRRMLPRRATKLHACSACAAIFESEAALSEHQADYNHAMESEGALTIDTDKLPKDDQQSYTIMENRYYIVKTKKGTEYCCFQCTRRFNKLANCTRHMRMLHQYGAIKKPAKHDNSSSLDSFEVTDNDKLRDAPYKCKMCPCAYHHPASLSKHINKAHIVDKVNTMVNTMIHT